MPTWQHFSSAWRSGFGILYGCKGHAVVRIGLDIDLNSWGSDWGDKGVGQWATDREIQRELSWYGAWALRLVTDPTGDGDV